MLSVVVPLFNEQAVLPAFAERTRAVLDALEGDDTDYEVLAVNDGSTDASAAVLAAIAATWPQLRAIRLRRNAGHQAAITAGLANAAGDWVITLDADLQDPPELIPELLAAARAGDVDVVYATRSSREVDPWLKRLTARAYYGTMRRVAGIDAVPQAGDYRLMSRAVVDDLCALPESQRVYRLLVPWLGYPSATVSYVRAARAAGTTHYPMSRMLRLGFDSLTSFTAAPLRYATWFGTVVSFVSLVLAVGAVSARLAGHAVPGWTSVVVAVLFIGAVQLLCVGLLGEYLGRLYAQSQGRPSYYIAKEPQPPVR